MHYGPALNWFRPSCESRPHFFSGLLPNSGRVHNPDVKPWLVYILECGDGTLYTGITTDLQRRLRAHARGKASKYVRARLPIRVVYQEKHETRSCALRRESQIKGLTRREKLGLAGC